MESFESSRALPGLREVYFQKGNLFADEIFGIHIIPNGFEYLSFNSLESGIRYSYGPEGELEIR